MVISRHLLDSYGLFEYVKFVEFFGVEFLDVFLSSVALAVGRMKFMASLPSYS